MSVYAVDWWIWMWNVGKLEFWDENHQIRIVLYGMHKQHNHALK